jgi:invasion protein IalB
VWLGLWLALLPVAAFAQPSQAPRQGPGSRPPQQTQPAQQPAPVPTVPERTTASFGDWVLRCERAGTDAQPRICEVAQAITLQGQQAPIAQIAFGRVTRGEAMRLTLVLPTNVTILAKPKVLSAKEDASPLELSWQRCVPAGCIAMTPVTDDVLARLGAGTESGSIVFKDASDREVSLPLSLRGLAQALAALAKE